jgi:NAD-dependent deacetylase
VVYPAASMPAHAKRAGARLVIVNRTPTPQDDEADLVVADGAAAVLSSVAALVAQRPAVT